jgi:cyclic pyranopterin phosphate synthase
MPLGQISDHEREETYCSNDEVREQIEQRYSLTPLESKTAGPSRYFQLENSATRVGFISPVSHNFCSTCNRVRVTVEGRLLLCLGNEYSVDLRNILRESPFDMDKLKQAIIDSLDIKPMQHHFYEKDHTQVVRFMNMTGG